MKLHEKGYGVKALPKYVCMYMYILKITTDTKAAKMTKYGLNGDIYMMSYIMTLTWLRL